MPKAPQSVNLEEGLPSREQAYAKLDAALEQARSGEDWSKFEERSRELLARAPELASDQDLGRKNKGITLVLL